MGGPKKPIARNTLEESSSSPWQAEVASLRAFLLACDLDEDIKWGKPCYSFGGNNIVIIQKMKSFLALMFFKGALLKDAKGLLKKPGENSNAARRFEFVSAQDIVKSEATIKRYIREAIEIESAGLKVAKTPDLDFAVELQARLAQDAAFKAAFEALTPGRQRGYNLYFSAPKGAEARQRRIEKYAPKILDGKGFHDR